LIRKIPKRSASEYSEALLSVSKQRSSSTIQGKIDKTNISEVVSEDEENNSLRRQTSSTSTSSNYSEQPSMDAIFEVVVIS
jgi:predicted secreted Zn-dependent protease